MNHKLQNTILAFTVVGAALLFGLMAAQPIDHGPSADGGRSAALPMAVSRAGSALADEARLEFANSIETRARVFEQDMDQAASAGEMMSLTSAFIAATIVEATLINVLDEIENGVEPAARKHPGAPPAAEQARSPARGRGALVMPYFSTAQGLRRGAGS